MEALPKLGNHHLFGEDLKIESLEAKLGEWSFEFVADGDKIRLYIAHESGVTPQINDINWDPETAMPEEWAISLIVNDSF